MNVLAEQFEEIKDEILENQTQAILIKINNYKHDMNYLCKSIRPAKEFTLELSRIDSDLIQE